MIRIISVIILFAGILSAQNKQINQKINNIDLLYNETGLDSLISRDEFRISFNGYNRLIENSGIDKIRENSNSLSK